MASFPVTRTDVGAHATLTANVVDTVTFGQRVGVVEVAARGGTADLWYTVDGSTPTIGGANCYVIPGGVIGVDERRPPAVAGPTVVKLLADAAKPYSVQRG